MGAEADSCSCGGRELGPMRGSPQNGPCMRSVVILRCSPRSLYVRRTHTSAVRGGVSIDRKLYSCGTDRAIPGHRAQPWRPSHFHGDTPHPIGGAASSHGYFYSTAAIGAADGGQRPRLQVSVRRSCWNPHDHDRGAPAPGWLLSNGFQIAISRFRDCQYRRLYPSMPYQLLATGSDFTSDNDWRAQLTVRCLSLSLNSTVVAGQVPKYITSHDAAFSKY